MSSQPIILRPEHPTDRDSIRRVHVEAFGRADEAELVDALRDGGWTVLSLVADRDGEAVGHVLFSRLLIQRGEQSIPALALAPLAVLPTCQRTGIGSALVRAGMEQSRAAGERIVVVLGHPEFYERLGFESQLARPLAAPFAGAAWQAAELQPGALTGVAGRVQYPPPFGVD